jgi:hypothetical protein
MNPNPQMIEWIKLFASTLPGGLEGNTPEEVVFAANNPTANNPSPPPMVSKPFAVGQLLGFLSSATVTRLRDFPSLPRMLDDVNGHNVEGCNLWLTLLLSSGDISREEHDAISGVVNATEPDPGWRFRVGAAELAIGRMIDPFDVLEAKS